jgi:hypothetical protein
VALVACRLHLVVVRVDGVLMRRWLAVAAACRQIARRSTAMRRDLSRATGHPLRRAIKVLAALGGATLLLLATNACTGSSTPTYAQLEKAARKVPVPPGVTFVDVTRTKMDPGSGITYEVDVSYSNPSMTCDQLRTAWIAALTEAHRGTHPVAPNDGQIFVKDSSFSVAIDLGSVDVHNCARPAVGASTT